MNTKAQIHKAISGGLTSKGRPLALRDLLEARRRPLPPIAPIKAAAVTPRLVRLAELEHDQCRYPYDADNGTLFCGQPKAPIGPYCQAHHDLCYMPLDQVRERRFLKSIGKAEGLATIASSIAA